MADYQKPQVRFVNHGMKWSRSIDTIELDKWCYLKNVRSYLEGTMTSRPGLTQFVSLGSTINSIYTIISRLNNNNSLAYGNNFNFVYVLGLNTVMYVGIQSSDLNTAAINPIATPLTPGVPASGNPFSGNPLSVVDMSPVGANLPFKYIGDTFQNCSVGYYPGDVPGTNMARCITMGILPPINQTIPAAAGAGNLTGSYQWRFVFRHIVTGAQSNPSAPTRVTLASPGLSLSAQQASFTLPTTPIDPQTNLIETHVTIDVYRFGGTVFRWKLVGSGASGATFIDNIPDSSILTAQEPSQTVNPFSGISHFNLFQPFVVPDIQHTGTGNLAQVSGKWIFTQTGLNTFNKGWLPGSTIVINNAPPFTIFQVISSTQIELVEDATRVGTVNGVPWSVPAGTLVQGSPTNFTDRAGAMRHIWGPWGLGGQTGSYIFACGNALAPGTLFWTNGNDPDSTDTYNSLQVTNPSEPLMNGCMYQGNSYVWSTERMFQIVPSITVPGQFSVNEIPGAKGLFLEYCLSVQSTSIADITINWRGKDGIYEFSSSGGVRNITNDDLYPLFPHDNQASTPPATTFPFLPSGEVPAIDDTQAQKLTWFDGYLFYDYQGTVSSNIVIVSLVWDSRVQGWISFDIYPFSTGGFVGLPMCRGTEISGGTVNINKANNLKISIGQVVYDYKGTSDNGTAIPCRVVSRADDYGDGRNQKQLGDLMIDLNPAGVTVSPVLRTAYHNTTTALVTTVAAVRTQLIEDFSSGGGIYSITAGLDITWSASATGNPTLYQWELAYLVKPELTVARFTDWDDDGYEGAKFFQGAIVQVNTFGASAVLTIQFDGATLAQTFTVNSSGELEIPLAFNPTFIAHQVRIQSSIPIAMMGPFRIRWIWEPAPELAPAWITQGTSFGMKGYFQHRDFMPAIQSTDVVTFTITPDNRAAVSYTFASTGGVLLKPYTSLSPSKARIGQYQATSPTPFRLFQKDTELRIRDWGDPGPWKIVRPFGDLSIEKGARV